MSEKFIHFSTDKKAIFVIHNINALLSKKYRGNQKA
jgi:hypothetical protein